MLGSKQFKRIKDQGNIIFNSPYLENLSKIQRYEFIQLCHRRKYNKDEHIYYQDDPGTGIYFIEKGRVELSTEVGENDGNYTQILQSPDSFGVLSIGYEFPRFTTARCMEDCILLGFFKPDLETLKKRNPQIAINFIETLATITMKQLSTAIRELEKLSTPQKVIALKFEAFYNKVSNL